jgi:predicted amino acid-binding ACT domain protein
MLLVPGHRSFGVLLCLSEKLFHLSALRMVRIRLKKLLPGVNRLFPVALRIPPHKANVEQCVGIVGIETQRVIPSVDCLILVPVKMIGTAELYEDDGVLIVGVDKLLTQLGRCCKPAPRDPIQGYITRGKGISIHRSECPNFAGMARLNPERVIAADWGDSAQAGESGGASYPVDITVECADRTGLLRDITEVLSREMINVTAVNTISRQGKAYMNFTMEVTGIAHLQRALKLIGEIPSVLRTRRA